MTDTPALDYVKADEYAKAWLRVNPYITNDGREINLANAYLALREENANLREQINIDGVWLTKDDILRGYMRQADYSRKTQQIAATSERLGRLEAAIDALAADLGPEPDWVAVARTDPHGWVQRKISWENRNTALESARSIARNVRENMATPEREPK